MVPHCNKVGGLVILWKEGFPLEVEKYSKNYIDTVINKGKENAWRFTGFMENWTPLRDMKHGSSYEL